MYIDMFTHKALLCVILLASYAVLASLINPLSYDENKCIDSVHKTFSFCVMLKYSLL